jgi:hypothetical protein
MKAATAVQPAGQMPKWAKAALIAGAILLFLIVSAIVPVPVRPYLDFQVLYQANMGLLRGVSLYDHGGQVNMIAQLAHVTPEHVYVLPFPYPPWYALSTIWLAWLPIEAAARVWFGISLVLLLASAWLLTERWAPIRRIAALGLAIFFLPVLGSLSVGQYGFPVLAGAALMIHALHREKALRAAVAAALLTFKPHLGGLILLAVLICLWQRRDAFGRRAMMYSLGAGLTLFCVGFLADRAWPVNYIRSLLSFQKDAGVASCGLCASLPVLIADRMGSNPGLGLAVVIGIIILAVLTILWLMRRSGSMRNPYTLTAASILLVLLASPYLLNYDFVLLLVPFALLAGGERSFGGWVVIAVAYLLPFVALGLWGRQGNFVFPLCAMLALAMLYRDKQLLDVSLPAA